MNSSLKKKDLPTLEEYKCCGSRQAGHHYLSLVAKLF
jgi:hypothetical protein